MSLLDGYKIYKDVQGKEYNSIPDVTKVKLKQFRKDLGVFTDNIFNGSDRING